MQGVKHVSVRGPAVQHPKNVLKLDPSLQAWSGKCACTHAFTLTHNMHQGGTNICGPNLLCNFKREGTAVESVIHLWSLGVNHFVSTLEM